MFNYIFRGLMGEFDNPGQSEKKKEFHWLTIDALFFWIIEICELCKWCGKSILGVFHRKKIDKNSDMEAEQASDKSSLEKED